MRTNIDRETIRVDSQNVVPYRDVPEINKLVFDVEHNYGIFIDSHLGANSAKASAGSNTRPEVLDRIHERAWSIHEITGVSKALANYAPILGNRRIESSRAGHVQEVQYIAAVTQAITRGETYVAAVGEYKADTSGVNLYALNVVGGENSTLRTVTHELAHGLLGYAQKDFVKAGGYWSQNGTPMLKEGAEIPPSAKSLKIDFEETATLYFLMGNKMAEKYPNHFFALSQIFSENPSLATRVTGVLARQKAKAIATNISLQELSVFGFRSRSWGKDGSLLTAGEKPPTDYAATHPSEDLAESAMLYFVEPERFSVQCPARFNFMKRVTHDWTNSSGGRVTKSLELAQYASLSSNSGGSSRLAPSANHLTESKGNQNTYLRAQNSNFGHTSAQHPNR